MTTAVSELVPVDVREIPIELVFASPDNPRKTFNPAQIEELAASVRQHGVQVLLLVRPCAKSFEIVCGHRRRAAAEVAGLATVPCIVREMTDEEAAEIAIVDNLQRVDVPALEEAEAFKALLEMSGGVGAVAARVGKDVAYVTRRLQLVALSEMPRKALAERLITVDHALLLARLGEEEQNTNLKWALNKNAGVKETVENVIAERIKDISTTGNKWRGPWEPESVLSLKHHIEQNVGRKLSRAPWSLDDATLVKDVPACNACPSNTKHNDSLFGDLNIQAATCEDGICFLAKRTAFVQLKLAEIPKGVVRNEPPPKSGLNGVDRYVFPLRLSWKTSTVVPRLQRKGFEIDRDGYAPEQVFRYGQWIDAKPKSCDFVRQGVTVDWSDDANRGYMGTGEKLRKPGQVVSVCVAAKCKVHRKGYEKAKSSNGSAPYDSKAQAEKEEQQRQAAIAEGKIRVFVAGKAIDVIKSIPAEALRELVLSQLPNWGEEEKLANALLPGMKKIAQTAKADSVEFAKALAIAVIENLVPNEYQGAEWGRKEFLASVRLLGYDGTDAWKKQAEPKEQPKAKKSVLSADAKKRIAEAQRKRWAAAAAKKPAKKTAKKKAGR